MFAKIPTALKKNIISAILHVFFFFVACCLVFPNVA